MWRDSSFLRIRKTAWEFWMTNFPAQEDEPRRRSHRYRRLKVASRMAGPLLRDMHAVLQAPLHTLSSD